jgi:hypothetical protein
VVSTTIDAPSPWIRTELAFEKPTATHTPSVTLITSRRNSPEWARSFSRPANSCAAAVPHKATGITSIARALLALLRSNKRIMASEADNLSAGSRSPLGTT